MYHYGAARAQKKKGEKKDGKSGKYDKDGKKRDESSKKKAGKKVGRCTLTPPDPQLKGAWFQTLTL